MSLTELALPDELQGWIGGAALYESSGESGARTVRVERDGGAYLKIAPKGKLERAARMQAYFAAKDMSAELLRYIAADRDYLLVRALRGEDGIAARHLAEPERLSALFGESLRALHEADASDCPPAADVLPKPGEGFLQGHLDLTVPFIGGADAGEAGREIEATHGLLRQDALVHGDHCLPNIMIDGWKFTGYIDVADGGLGDRHYDLAWGLWTIRYNLGDVRYGERFLNAYGRDVIDPARLRLCGLLAAVE